MNNSQIDRGMAKLGLFDKGSPDKEREASTGGVIRMFREILEAMREQESESVMTHEQEKVMNRIDEGIEDFRVRLEHLESRHALMNERVNQAEIMMYKLMVSVPKESKREHSESCKAQSGIFCSCGVSKDTIQIDRRIAERALEVQDGVSLSNLLCEIKKALNSALPSGDKY